MKNALHRSISNVLTFALVAVLGLTTSTPNASAQEVVLGDNWQNMPGRAKDIGGGADGSVWIIGSNDSPYKWNDAGYAWEQASGSAKRISVLPDGTPVIMNAEGRIFKLRGSNWQELPGRAKDIAAGADGSIWIIGSNDSPYVWNEEGYAWEQRSGTANRISIMANGTPVVVNAEGRIFMMRGQNWQELPGRANDIGTGADGSIWIIGDNGSPYKWNDAGYAWEQKQGTGTQITLSGPGIPWVLNAGGEVFRMVHRIVETEDEGDGN